MDSYRDRRKPRLTPKVWERRRIGRARFRKSLPKISIDAVANGEGWTFATMRRLTGLRSNDLALLITDAIIDGTIVMLTVRGNTRYYTR